MIYIVGAGPGDPKLITVKGQELLQRATCIVYAGSLVNPALLDLAPEGCALYNSAKLTLDETVEILLEHHAKPNSCVVRLHTGDPSLYGAIKEQIDRLAEHGVDVEVVPGVTSAFAASATLKREFTVPDLSQTLVISRIAGRTPVPESQSPAQLAKLHASYAFFLSVGLVQSLVDELIEGGLDPETPAAAVYKASWPEESALTCSLKELPAQIEAAGFTKTTMILVGEFLDASFAPSKLYDPTFSHEFRSAKA